MYGSALTVRTGAVNQSAFEILRQVWLVSMQVFECLNVATQSMAATLLGAGDTASARALLLRALTLSTSVGAVAGAVVWMARQPLVSLFSSDVAVVATALSALPLVCAMLPLDAAASITDGGLMAASQTDALSIIQVSRGVWPKGVTVGPHRGRRKNRLSRDWHNGSSLSRLLGYSGAALEGRQQCTQTCSY